ncbi:adenylate/guanylate cyclase domain-containing protein [Bradyrhizobium sp. Arg237L]|uniref:adenylate/guanylate cyclase domain-containing protein n=1 Tax=Bradyrhizobium sp. Arg237L TaxID=3003352 RepID=UPI00249F649E|nr:adenylate/guanylate cyclase domain-containing protein [Bradyrhizobium sp. Arg237L]MDI4231977.1 adenylate/guanylate cyclase domain-containing protein [Bradyrhizobium sp. Arg237L]
MVDRVLATVLFTDLVGSTEKAAALGDHRWCDLLDTHHTAIRRTLSRFGGHEIKTTGDVGELLKLVLVERLLSLTRDKLMTIPAFAWAYTKFREAKAWLKNTEAWQAIRAISKAARQYLTEMKNSAAVAFRRP